MSTLSEIVSLQKATLMAATTITSVSAFGAALGVSHVVSKFVESAARQPEVMGALFMRTLAVAALVDVVPMIGIGFAGNLLFSSPFTNAVIELLPKLV